MVDKNSALIVPNGTQIVALTESKATGEDRFHPVGAVGKIIRAPADATHSYVVEFPDGSRAALKRTEFSVRKRYQTEIAFRGGEEPDLNQFIIYRCVVGSRAFGLDDAASDTDYRGIYLPPARLHWSLYGVPEQLENKDKEECFWELQKFLMLALKANPNILECLHTPLVEYQNEIAAELLSIKQIFFSKLVYQTYNGYVMSQFKKLEQDLRARGEIRWKHAMHLIRLILQGIEILKSGALDVRVSKHRDELLAVKGGAMSWESLNDWRLRLHREFETAFAETRLPDRPDYERANDFLIGARRRMV
ncbi:MAG TPA: nucleotidyltransferase domain-containing protein [Pyrinomonadaceae bacterium]